MRAVPLTGEGPALAVADVEDPQPGPGEVVLRVTGCGICGSDLHVAKAMAAPGVVLGHEIAGVIDEIGSGVEGWAAGRAVTGRPLAGCGACRWCTRGRPDHCASFELVGFQRPGGFAERTVLRADELFALPAGLTGPEQALVEPFAVARRGLRRGALEPGEHVAVLGAGPIGLAAAHWARALGAGHIVVSDPVERRRELALALGADLAVEPAELAAAAGAPSLVVECSGSPGVLDQALQLADVDGRVAVVGICSTPDTYLPWWGISKELDVRFSIFYGREDFTDTIDAFDRGALRPGEMITETVSLDELPERFARLLADPDAGKVVVVPYARAGRPFV